MAKSVGEGFDSFDDGLLTIMKDAVTDVTELFRKLEGKLEECEAFQVASGSKDFVKDVHLIRDILLKDIHKISRGLNNGVEAVKHLILLDYSDHSSYVAEVMRPAYEKCKLVTQSSATTTTATTATGKPKYQKGAAHNERVAIVRERVKGSPTDAIPSIFEAVATR